MNEQEWMMVAIILLTHVVGGILAFGSSLLALAAMVFFLTGVELSNVVFVLALCGLFQACIIVSTTYSALDYRVLRRLLLCALLGLPIGYLLQGALEGHVLQLVLGALLFVGGLWALLPERTQKMPWMVQNLGLFGAGLVHGCCASGGTVLIPVLRIMLPDKDKFRATLAMFWVIVDIVLISMSMVHAAPQFAHLAFPAVSVGAAVLATMVGQYIAKRIDNRIFKRLIAVFMMLAGILYIAAKH